MAAKGIILCKEMLEKCNQGELPVCRQVRILPHLFPALNWSQCSPGLLLPQQDPGFLKSPLPFPFLQPPLFAGVNNGPALHYPGKRCLWQLQWLVRCLSYSSFQTPSRFLFSGLISGCRGHSPVLQQENTWLCFCFCSRCSSSIT